MTIGPRDPATETGDEYLERIIATAGLPTPEEATRLSQLLPGLRFRGYPPCKRCGRTPRVYEADTWPEHECPGPPDLRR